MNDFKKGDTVRRIHSDFGNVKVGDILTVKKVEHNALYSEGHMAGFTIRHFELISEENSIKHLLSLLRDTSEVN